eukprot:Gb_12764 [translate_table: standard]
MTLQDYGSAVRMDTNDSLRLASLWHSMHVISQQLSPIVGCTGIELLEADTFDLHCFRSLTGTKFFVVTEPGTQGMEFLLKTIYELYTDYVLKNPFYEMKCQSDVSFLSLIWHKLSERTGLHSLGSNMTMCGHCYHANLSY